MKTFDRKGYMKEYNQKYKQEHRAELTEKERISRKLEYAKHYNRWLKSKLKLKYGLKIEDYYLMLKKQNNACAICFKTEFDNKMRLAVDHDHKTGKIRGLLCDACNKGLGNFVDNPEFIFNAFRYINSNAGTASSVQL